MRAPMRDRQRRALPDQVRHLNIPAAWVRKDQGGSGPLKSDCPLECVRACRVCTGCGRDVERARRQVCFNPSIDGRMVRASRARFPDLLCRCERSLSTAAYRPPRRPIPWAGRAAAFESPAPRGAGPIGPVPRRAGPARFGRCTAATAPRTRRPRAHHALALTICERPVDAGTTALGGRHGHGRGRGGRRRPRRCGRRARGAPGAGGGRWDGRARAQSACSGTSIRATGRARAAQVGAVASGAPASSGPAPGRSAPARGGSLAVPRPERASGACLRASRGRSRAEWACAKKKGVNTWVWWCEYVCGVAEWCRVRPL